MKAARRELGAGWLAIVLPYGWLLVLFLAPFVIVAAISLGESAIGIPPYTPPLSFADGLVPNFNVKLGNYGLLFGDRLYIRAYLNSLALAGGATLLCLLVGYPMAYAIARAPVRWRNPLLMLIVLPFWTSFLIRVYAWIGILKSNGLINNFLLASGIVDEPLPLLNNIFSVELALVYSYLPFMILPLYATLERMDAALLEAAADLGCRPLRAFLAVTLPLSLPGIAAGCLLVFIPAVGEFVIPDLLGGPDTLMIGKVLWEEFFTNRDWPVASAVAIAMLVLLVAPIALAQRALRHGEGTA
jgi:putrescine transport system permease protein